VDLFSKQITDLQYLKSDVGLEILSGLGVILLLFEVGLDSSLADLLKVGLSSLLVATIGVILPFGLGWLVSSFLLTGQSPLYARVYPRDALRDQRGDHREGAPRHEQVEDPRSRDHSRRRRD
jgi:hypothetical protein